MKLLIKATPEEIAEFVLELQTRQPNHIPKETIIRALEIGDQEFRSQIQQ